MAHSPRRSSTEGVFLKSVSKFVSALAKMARYFTLCFLLLLILSWDEKRVPLVEAKDCYKVWTCKGGDRCWEDCRNRFNGRGMCDLYTAPPVPKQCFCVYKC